MIYLQHFLHGRKIAYMEAEAVNDEKHGWKRYNPDTPAVESVDETPVNAMVGKRKYTRKTVEVEGV